MFRNFLTNWKKILPRNQKYSTDTVPNALKESLVARGRLDLLKKLENQEVIPENDFPNLIHPEVLTYGDEPKIVETINELPASGPNSTPSKTFHEICQKLNLLRMDVGQFAGSKSYYLLDDLAEMESALILYAVKRLKSRGFTLISVPDILPASAIEACGMQVYGERNQVYKFSNNQDGSDLCLSGTSEMALASLFAGQKVDTEKLPLRLMAVSRCFRAETSTLNEEKGIYRVHQFNKVEMFGICEPHFSPKFLEEFRAIQTDLFRDLGVNFKVLDMPPHELGSPAYRKYDMESWMPGRKMYGELSSCSNCTDYQSKRLNIRKSDGEFVHTINGTAAAIPRLLIAIIESFQNAQGYVEIPKVLQEFMGGKERITKKKGLPEVKLVKDITEEMIIK